MSEIKKCNQELMEVLKKYGAEIWIETSAHGGSSDTYAGIKIGDDTVEWVEWVSGTSLQDISITSVSLEGTK